MVTTLIAFGYSRFRYAADVSLIVLAAVAVAGLAGGRGYAARRAESRV